MIMALLAMVKAALIGVVNLGILAIAAFATLLIAILPPSPFHMIDSIDIPYLDNLNWILPVEFMLGVITYWLGAIVIYYIVSIGLRWVKAVQ